MSGSLTHLARRWFEEVWNQGRTETVEALYAEDAVSHGLTLDGTALKGRAALVGFQALYRTALPDLEFVVEDAIEGGDRCAVRFRVRGTHTGPFLALGPTGRPIEVGGQCFLRFRDGHMVETWNQFDLFGLLAQLGAVTRPTSVPGSNR
jgi:steroid delta-isomerase-like uncharacterized protein